MAAALSVSRDGFRLVGKRIENLTRSPAAQEPSDDTQTEAEYSAEDALGFICRNNFTRAQYQDIRVTTMKAGSNLYPSYNKIVTAKEKTYPNDISIKPSCAEVPLQSLVDHTIQRLVEFLNMNILPEDSIRVIFKWGCDGSSNHSRYKQQFFDEDSDGEIIEYNDSHIFAISLVPVRVVRRQSGDGSDQIIWNNELPSSVSLCRPLKLIFSKENAELTKSEVSKMETSIKNLMTTRVVVGDVAVEIAATLVLTMVDTKVVNDVAGSHSQQCYICHRSGKRLNEPFNGQKFDAPDLLKCVFSPLHAQIRTMELLLNVSYRLTLPEPSWRVSEDNTIVKDRQVSIRQALKEELGLRLNEPLPGGGNSNDGNTARRFFREVEKVASITGLNRNLLSRFATLLFTVNCNKEIDEEVQVLKALVLGEEERGQSQYQVMCFVTKFQKGDFITADAMAKLRQKNPSTIRTPEEDKGKENYTMTGWVVLDRASPISRHISPLCSEAPEATYARDVDLKAWAELPGSSISILESAVKAFPSVTTGSPPSRCSEVSAIWAPCICTLEMCIGWYPCGLKYCKGKPENNPLLNGGGSSYRCGIKTCRKCHQYSYYVREKQQCLWDE
ncbi:AAEL003578-PA [Aedes aegypti]|uniref:AAEL003578-PA n=1 Tax=Aedes aegypti TaxID=7159 RepID=Q17F27_AEDAE|nr:AAEL003578-PA [Aedes aegypti]